MTRRPRRANQPLTDPTTDPRPSVGLRVAAGFLGIDERTVRARIETGELPAVRDGRVYIIAVAELAKYDAARRIAP